MITIENCCHGTDPQDYCEECARMSGKPEEDCAAHTAGPWYTESDNVQKQTNIRNQKNVQLAIVLGNAGSYETKEQEANARLIAAAPELLAACHMALEKGDDLKALQAIRYAIAKAQGTL